MKHFHSPQRFSRATRHFRPHPQGAQLATQLPLTLWVNLMCSQGWYQWIHGQVWCCRPVIQELRRLTQSCSECEVNPNHTELQCSIPFPKQKMGLCGVSPFAPGWLFLPLFWNSPAWLHASFVSLLPLSSFPVSAVLVLGSPFPLAGFLGCSQLRVCVHLLWLLRTLISTPQTHVLLGSLVSQEPQRSHLSLARTVSPKFCLHGISARCGCDLECDSH